MTLDLTNCAQLVESHTIHEKKRKERKGGKAHRQSIHLDQIKGEEKEKEKKKRLRLV